jgi:hypothetical protein
MLSFESNRVFQNKYNCFESLEDYKKHRKLQGHKESGRIQNQEVRKSQEVCKSKRRLPGLKKPEPQESGRLTDHESQEAEE